MYINILYIIDYVHIAHGYNPNGIGRSEISFQQNLSATYLQYNNTKITFGFWILYSKVLHHQVNRSDKNTRTSLPGYLSPSMGLKFADVPNGLAAITKVDSVNMENECQPLLWVSLSVIVYNLCESID